jgi:hypothetical protein
VSHFFDQLAKALAGVEVLGGPRRMTDGGFSVVRAPAGVVIEAGPCVTYRDGSELTGRFSTRSTLGGRSAISLDVTTRRHLESGDVDADLALAHTDGDIARLKARHSADAASEVTVDVRSGEASTQVRFEITPETLNGWVDDRPFEPIPRSLLVGSDGAVDLSLFRLADGSSVPGLALPLGREAEFRAIASKTERSIPICMTTRGSISTLDPIDAFPGCTDCLDHCTSEQTKCIAKAVAKAGGCGPFFGVCLAALGADCLSDDADCSNACHASGGACCPKRCQDASGNGYASCCSDTDICCGATCCSTGLCCGSSCCAETQHCGDPDHGTCCPNDGGPACGPSCCQRGQKCADRERGYCCDERAGEYCPDAWGNDKCCPAGQVCADGESGACCPKDHGPVCGNGDMCCRPGEVCDGFDCCDPRDLCGPPGSQVCCRGECHDGICCAQPYHMCGDVCCSPFAPCCDVGDGPVCCGDFEVCKREGCCPTDRACGSICCPTGQHCTDTVKEICESCPDGQLGCFPEYPARPNSSICCAPNVGCCIDECCQPGEACCHPNQGPNAGGPLGCYPWGDCYQIK